MSRLGLQLEHRVLKTLKSEDLPRRWLLAVSGGLDSLVMAELLWRWRRYLKIEIAVAYVHHGSDEEAQANYRNQAQTLVRSWAKTHRVRFITLKAKARGLRSEAELRDFRHRTLEQWRTRYGYDVIALAHHRDDLLETRLLRLIRGSGPQGLRAMRLRDGRKIRPLLSLSRHELESYAAERALTFIEDPSNLKTDAFRNWLRREWLPSLEQKQKGALKSLSRSLEILAPETNETQLSEYVGLRRKEFGQMSCTRQQTVVAEYLRALGVRGYGRAHIEEILKRLDTRKKEFTFEMLGFRFRVTPDLLWASRV